MNSHKVLFLLSTLSALSLYGTDYTWNVDAPGNWDSAPNWTPNTAFPNSSADTATFGNVITLPTTVTVDGVFAVDSLTFSSPISYTIAPLGIGNYLTLGGGGGLQNIVLTGTGSHEISSPLTLASNMVINQGSTGTLTLSGGVSGLHNVVQQGTGFVILSAANSYTGSTTIQGGTMQAGAASVFSPTSDFIVNAVLDLNDFSNTINSLSGSGSVTTGLGTLSITNGGTYSGTIVDNGSVVLNGGSLAVSGAISGSGTVVTNAGTLTLSAANSYSGEQQSTQAL